MKALTASAIVTTYECRRFVTETLESVRAQTRPPTELIVVDDSSTDGTAELVAEISPGALLTTTARLGPSGARNAGLALATGDVIAFLDGDDRWRPDKLEKQVARLEDRPDLDICGGLVEQFWDDEVPPEERLRRTRGDVVAGWVWSAAVIRRTAFDRVGGIDTTRAHADKTEWLLRAREAGLEFEMLDEVVLDRRLHRSNFSLRQEASSVDEYLDLLADKVRRGRR